MIAAMTMTLHIGSGKAVPDQAEREDTAPQDLLRLPDQGASAQAVMIREDRPRKDRIENGKRKSLPAV